MLSLLLILTAAPQATIPDMPQALVPLPHSLHQPEPPGSIPNLGRSPFVCRSDRVLTVAPRQAPTNGLQHTFTPGAEESVSLYRLLDRRIGGCPDPIVVIQRVPGSNAIDNNYFRR